LTTLKDKIVLITGGGSGIGRAAVDALHAEGAIVVFSDINAAAGKAVLADFSDDRKRIAFIEQDVTNLAQWAETVDGIVKEYGQLDVLVNNAGIFEIGDIETVSAESWRRVISTNLDGVFFGTQTAIKAMKENGGGSIINVCSIDGIVGHPLKAAYNASKGGVKQLTKSSALYCARMGYNIRVNSLCPGYTMTPLVANAIPHAPEGLPEVIAADTPMARFGDPAEIAKGVVYLASEQSSFVTGTELVIDGGYTAR